METAKPLKFDDRMLNLWATDDRYIILNGGRGGGKSFAVSTFLTELTYEEGQKILYTRYTMKSAEISIIPEFLEKAEKLEESGRIIGCSNDFNHNKAKDIVTNTKSGVEVIFRGIKTSQGIQTASLKSIHGITTWVIEEAEELVDEDVFDTIDNSIRKADSDLRVIIIWNANHTKHFLWKNFYHERGVKHDFTGSKDGVTFIYSHWADNIDNLNKTFIDKALRTKRTRKSRYSVIYDGKPKEDKEHALWQQGTMIDPFRITEDEFEALGGMKRIVVGLDPNVSAKKETASEPGVVACAMDFQAKPHFYVIKDASERMTPDEWARKAVGVYKNLQADAIIPEVNNGGDLVVMAINNVDKTVHVKPVRATRGKMVRAEPISGLYEQGRVHHVGFFPELEEELTEYIGEGESPGRFDACVWALTELSQMHKAEPNIRSL